MPSCTSAASSTCGRFLSPAVPFVRCADFASIVRCGDSTRSRPSAGTTPPQASKQTQADRLRRLHARAALFATPETFCSTQDIADVFGLRESDVRAARPLTARRIGRACMAPFGDWLVAIGIDLDALADRTAATRAPTVRTVDTPTLRPLGGPHSARR